MSSAWLVCGLQDQVVAPAPARGLDLVARVWPAGEEPRPKTLHYVLMGEAAEVKDPWAAAPVWC